MLYGVKKRLNKSLESTMRAANILLRKIRKMTKGLRSRVDGKVLRVNEDGIPQRHEPRMEITTMVGCPLMCTFCPQKLLIKSYGKDRDKFLSVENFEIVIDKLPKNVRIDFSGMSEPWANPDCTDMLELALKKGFNVAIYTTLYQMTEEDIDRVKDLIIEYHIQVNPVILHLPDSHNNMRGWKYSETWERAFKTLYGINKRFPGKVGDMTMDMNNRIFHPEIRHIPEVKQAEKGNASFRTLL